MTAGAGPALRDLHDEYDDRVTFVTLCTREAHPGERIEQHEDLATKSANARAYQQRVQIPWTIGVDGLDGGLHQRLGPANTAYAMGVDGRVKARLLWATDVRGVRRALEAVATDGQEMERRTRFVPVVRGAAEQKRILDLAGPRASRAMARGLPAAWLIGRIAHRLPPARPIVRGGVATALFLGSLAAGALALRRASGAWVSLRGRRGSPDTARG